MLVSNQLTNSPQDYTPTPHDHSLNTYGITPHATVKQPIYKNSWRWTCKCPKHVEAIYEKIVVKLFPSSWYIFLTYIYMMHGHTYIKSETCGGHSWEKIIVKLFASSWYIFLTYIYDARSHLYQIHLKIIHCSVRKSLPLVSALIQLNPLHTDRLVFMIHCISRFVAWCRVG